jgi:hypothetical protein
MTGDGKQFLEARGHVGRCAHSRFDVCSRLLQAGVRREQGWAALFTADMTEGKVPRWAELREK